MKASEALPFRKGQRPIADIHAVLDLLFLIMHHAPDFARQLNAQHITTATHTPQDLRAMVAWLSGLLNEVLDDVEREERERN